MNSRIIRFSAVLTGVVVWLASVGAWAQPAVRFPQGTNPGYGAGVYPPSTPAPVTGTTPLPSGSVPGMGAGSAPSSLGAPAFDAYGNGASMPGYTPSVPGVSGGSGAYGGAPATGSPNINVPLPPGTNGGPLPGAAPYGSAGPPPYGGTVPGTIGSNTPPALFPNGLNTTAWGADSMRFITPRVRYTWVNGGKQQEALGINDFDFSAAMAFPQFLFSTQPLYVVPSFSLHLWGGPTEPYGDLPSKAYSAFADFGWGTDPSRPISGEVGVRLGLFTDFETMNTDSFRILGQGLFRVQATQTLAVRGGVIYLNRNKIKMLPAGGVLWTPNPETRFDVFFPRPKLAQRITTLGNADMWWYVGGEYGGGAWTVQRSDGASDRVDINDLRLMLGLEWGQPAMLQQGHRKGFVEFGWVTEREIVYVRTPDQNPSLKDAFMLRAGFNY